MSTMRLAHSGIVVGCSSLVARATVAPSAYPVRDGSRISRTFARKANVRAYAATTRLYGPENVRRFFVRVSPVIFNATAILSRLPILRESKR